MRWSNPIGCTTNTYHPYTLEQALDGIARAGFSFVELSAVPGWTPHVDVHMDAGQRQALLQSLADRGLRPLSLSAHSDLASGDGAAHCAAAIEFAAALGVSVVVTAIGGHGSVEEDLQNGLVHLSGLADAAARHQITLALEVHGDLMASGAKGAALLAKINRPNVRMNYDTANCMFYGGVRAEDDLPAALPYLAHVHLKDKIGGRGVWNFPPIGQGEVNFRRVFDHLRAASYGGPLSVEIEFTDAGWPPVDEVDAAVASAHADLLSLLA